MSTPDYLAVGSIRRPHGLNGEVQVEVLTDHPEARFAPGAVVWLGLDPARGRAPVATEIETARGHGSRMLVLFAGVRDRSGADRLRGQSVWIPVEEAAELEEDSYYVHQLIGMRVETVDGVPLGAVVRLLETGATDVLVVTGEDGREVLLPMIKDVLVAVDVAAGLIRVDPLPGLLDL